MKYGLTNIKYGKIAGIFSEFPEIEKVIIFGSRAVEKYQNGSDIDLAIIGNNIDFSLLVKIHSKLEELPYGYTYDLINYHKIKNYALKEQIDKNGLVFYLKTA